MTHPGPTEEQRRARLQSPPKKDKLGQLKRELHYAKRDLYSRKYKSITLISKKVKNVQRIEKKIKEVLQCH